MAGEATATERAVHLIVDDKHAGRRLDAVLSELFPDFSRTLLTRNIRRGRARRADGVCLKPAHILRPGEEVLFEPEPIPPDDGASPEDIPLDIVHEDEALLVVNKPAGMVAHPAAGNRSGTLVNALLAHEPNLRDLPRAGLVHRLDKDTSGLLLSAKTQAAYTTLTARMQAREIRREYRCLVCGVVVSGGRIDEPLGRHPRHRTKMAVVPGGRPAVTHYRVVERLQRHTVLRVILETGRTHQIRVHMAHIRRPIFGDAVYGGRLCLPEGLDEGARDALRGFRRQALHAQALKFAHPQTGAELALTSPLPADLVKVIDALRASGDARA